MSDPMETPHPVETPRPTCKATNKQGTRCRKPPIPGGTVCNLHGGSAPQVKRKASLRLLELVDPAIATLARTMTDPAAPHAARLRAAENVLDRAGVPRKVDVTDTEAAKALLLERLLAAREATPDHVQEQQPTTRPHQIVQGEATEITTTEENHQ